MRTLRLYRYGRFEESKPKMGLTFANGKYKAEWLYNNEGKEYDMYIAFSRESIYLVDAEKNELVLKNNWKLGESYGKSDCIFGDNFHINTELALDSEKIKITTYTYKDFANLVLGISENCKTIEEAKHYLEEHGLHNSPDYPDMYKSAPVYPDFVHLNVHSHYSIMRSQITIPAAVDKAVADGMKGMALTDMGVMYGIKEFVDYCAKINKKRAKEGLEPFKPIIGCEMYVAPRTMHDKEKGDEKCGRLIVLAKNLTGYKNLCKLVSNSWTEGLMDETPRTDHAELEKYKEGLIVIVSGNNSEIANYAIAGDMGKALSVGEWYKNTFGNDFYLGIKRNETLFKSESLRPHDIEEVRSAYVKIDNEYNIKSVCVNSCNYLNEEDGVVLDHVLAIANNKTLDDSSCPHHVEGEWMKTREELTELFRGKSDARINSLELFEKIEFYSIDNASLLPKVQIPECKNMGIAISLPEINIEKARRECVKVCRDEHDIIFGLKKCENGYIAQKIQDEEEYEFYITNGGFLTTAGYNVCILDSYLIDPLYANGWNYHLSYNWGCVTDNIGDLVPPEAVFWYR